MTDLYLRTTIEQDLRDACPFLLDDDGNWLTDTAQFSLSVIGAIPPTYAMNEDGTPGEMSDPGDDRFHANLRVLDDAVLALVPPQVVLTSEPGAPVRQWA